MPQPLSYHAFADCRTFWSVPNFFNVVSNLPFLAGGALGLAQILRGGGRFIDPREQLPYLVFFLGALLTCFGSAYYHRGARQPAPGLGPAADDARVRGPGLRGHRRARGPEARPARAVAAARARRRHASSTGMPPSAPARAT